MKTIKLILLLIVPGFSWGQQVPFYSNTNLLPALYNPAVTGLDNLWSVNLLRRAQWVGFDGAPLNNNLFADKNISDKHGIGINVIQESRGITSSIALKGMYAYHLKINENSFFDAGVSFGVANEKLNVQSGAKNIQDANDPMVLRGDVASSTIDGSIGLNYRWKKFQAGIAVPQILGQYNSVIYHTYERAYIVHAIYEFPLTYKTTLQPYAIARYAPNSPLQYDVKARILFLDNFWVGSGYRSDYAITIDAGFNLKSFYLAYSYDLQLNNFSNYGQSHEIMIGFRKKPKGKIVYNDL